MSAVKESGPQETEREEARSPATIPPQRAAAGLGRARLKDHLQERPMHRRRPVKTGQHHMGIMTTTPKTSTMSQITMTTFKNIPPSAVVRIVWNRGVHQTWPEAAGKSKIPSRHSGGRFSPAPLGILRDAILQWRVRIALLLSL
jgi:hypothetical protein